jgi:hypothetical protein
MLKKDTLTTNFWSTLIFKVRRANQLEMLCESSEIYSDCDRFKPSYRLCGYPEAEPETRLSFR